MRVFSIIQKLRRKSRSFQAFVSNSICSLHLNTLAKSSMPFFSLSLFLPLSHVRPHTRTHTDTQLGAESCSLMRIRTQGLHCFVYGWEDRVMRVAEVHRIVGWCICILVSCASFNFSCDTPSVELCGNSVVRVHALASDGKRGPGDAGRGHGGRGQQPCISSLDS